MGGGIYHAVRKVPHRSNMTLEADRPVCALHLYAAHCYGRIPKSLQMLADVQVPGKCQCQSHARSNYASPVHHPTGESPWQAPRVPRPYVDWYMCGRTGASQGRTRPTQTDMSMMGVIHDLINRHV